MQGGNFVASLSQQLCRILHLKKGPKKYKLEEYQSASYVLNDEFICKDMEEHGNGIFWENF